MLFRSRDSVHVVNRLPRDSDSIFAAGEMESTLTDARGCMSRHGACAFTPPGTGSMVAWVARDGIWVTELVTSPVPITDTIDWNGRVDVTNLDKCSLVDDPINRRLVFIYRKLTDTTHNTGIWYLDYQQYSSRGIRITFADHGPLAHAVTIAASDGNRRLASIDSRAGNGQVYIEATQDADESNLVNSSGAVSFSARSKEFMPAGARGTVSLGKATWMHDVGPATITHNFYFDRRDSNPETKTLTESTSRTASDVVLGQDVNSLSLELKSVGTVSYGVHWFDIEGIGVADLGGRGGA